MSFPLSINDIRAIENKKEMRRKKLYDRHLKKCYHHILAQYKKTDGTTSEYTVSQGFGQPLFDTDECIEYIQANMRNMGITIVNRGSGRIFIDWTEVSNKPKKPKKQFSSGAYPQSPPPHPGKKDREEHHYGQSNERTYGHGQNDNFVGPQVLQNKEHTMKTFHDIEKTKRRYQNHNRQMMARSSGRHIEDKQNGISIGRMPDLPPPVSTKSIGRAQFYVNGQSAPPPPQISEFGKSLIKNNNDRPTSMGYTPPKPNIPSYMASSKKDFDTRSVISNRSSSTQHHLDVLDSFLKEND
jgi:hypothetical protein